MTDKKLYILSELQAQWLSTSVEIAILENTARHTAIFSAGMDLAKPENVNSSITPKEAAFALDAAAVVRKALASCLEALGNVPKDLVELADQYEGEREGKTTRGLVPPSNLH